MFKAFCFFYIISILGNFSFQTIKVGTFVHFVWGNLSCIGITLAKKGFYIDQKNLKCVMLSK